VKRILYNVTAVDRIVHSVAEVEWMLSRTDDVHEILDSVAEAEWMLKGITDVHQILDIRPSEELSMLGSFGWIMARLSPVFRL
jgi:hypothetical protein